MFQGTRKALLLRMHDQENSNQMRCLYDDRCTWDFMRSNESDKVGVINCGPHCVFYWSGPSGVPQGGGVRGSAPSGSQTHTLKGPPCTFYSRGLA